MKAVMKGNLLVSLLLLFTITFSTPRVAQSKIVAFSEWTQKKKQERHSSLFSLGITNAQNFRTLPSTDQFNFGVLNSLRLNRVEKNQLKITKAFFPTDSKTIFLRGNHSDDDDYPLFT